MESITNNVSGIATADSATELQATSPVQTAAPDSKRGHKGKGKGKAPKAPTSGAPDYANMPTSDLIDAWSAYVRDVRSDIATLAINTLGTTSDTLVKGELAALVAVGIGLRKAYGRGIKRDVVAKLLPAVTIPADFNPTFGLFLSAAKLRADDASERKVMSDIRAGLRATIRTMRRDVK